MGNGGTKPQIEPFSKFAALVRYNANSLAVYMAILSLFASSCYLCPRFTFSQWVSPDKKMCLFKEKKKRKKVCFCFVTNQAPLKACFLKWETYSKPTCWLLDPQVRLSDYQKLLVKIIKTRVTGQVTVILIVRQAHKSLGVFFAFEKQSCVNLLLLHSRNCTWWTFAKLQGSAFQTEHSSKSSARAF